MCVALIKDKKKWKLFSKPEQAQITAVHQQVDQQLREAIKNNDGIYKEHECPQHELPAIPAKPTEVKPKPPGDILKSLPEAQAFADIVSEDMQLLIANFKNVVQEQKSNIITQNQAFKQRKGQAIEQHYVNFLLIDPK